MDIHSNEVKAINNSGGNAHPHLVPFLLKSSVCNKRSSHVNALALALTRTLIRQKRRNGGKKETERERETGSIQRGVCLSACERKIEWDRTNERTNGTKGLRERRKVKEKTKKTEEKEGGREPAREREEARNR